MKLNLVENGIFPIKNKLEKDSTGYSFPGTFQGEGKLLGTPCLFVRTSGCNLRCAWVGADGKGSPCDTPYSSHNPEKNITTIDEIVTTLLENNARELGYVVISGGEPMIQKVPLGELCKELQEEGIHVTIETNGTVFNQDVAENTNLMSISPKLSTSTPWLPNLLDTGIEYSEKWANRHEKLRINLESIQKLIDSANLDPNRDFQLKFVVATEDDLKEIEHIVERLDNVSPGDICLMPEGVDVSSLNSRTSWMAEQALRRGWRFTPRLHVMMFGKNRYV